MSESIKTIETNNLDNIKIIHKLINGLCFRSFDDETGERYFLIKQTTIQEIFATSDIEISKFLIEKGFPIYIGMKSQIIKNQNIELLKLLKNKVSFYDDDLELAKKVGNKEMIKIIVDNEI